MFKNRVLYACIFLSALIFAYFFGGKVPYGFLYVVILMPIISFLYTIVILIRFKYTESLDKNFITKGDIVNYNLSIHNEDFFLYPYMRINFCGDDSIFKDQFRSKNLSLLPFKDKKYTFELECKYRGNYGIGIKSVQIEDFFGLFRLTYKNAVAKHITVYPRIVFLERFNLKTNYICETNSTLNNRFEDMTTVSDIRKYAYGDSLKKIHWKLTAKTRDMMVKNFQSTTQTSSVIFLDLLKSPYSHEVNTIIEDKVLESCISVIYYCLNNWVPINLVYFKSEIINRTASSPLDFNEIYDTLTTISFIEKIGLKDLMKVHLMDNITNSNLVLCTSNMSYELYNEIYNANYSGYDLSIIYISPSELTGSVDSDADTILSNLTEAGVDVYKLNISDDIKYILER
ncbi:MAG TPA: DUF58 domain-containing protein [Pseudobacteroides sp.]|uniref:DUF58 domain-containing protein n=1 Tax=Pseudobacteroides sp. TaxID=1968840 RepID=UPI002F95E814